MKTRIVRIGNSQGVRIPRPLIEQAGLSDEVEISVQEGSLVIKAVAKHRAGWATAFESMASQGDDALLDGGSVGPSTWEAEEWEW